MPQGFGIPRPPEQTIAPLDGIQGLLNGEGHMHCNLHPVVFLER